MSLRCPRCYHEGLVMVGAYVYAGAGLPENDAITMDDVFVTQKLYRCPGCEAHIPENEVAQGEERSRNAIRWEVNQKGRSIPIVCPLCKNVADFIRDGLVLRVVEENIRLQGNAEMRIEYTEVGDTAREWIPLRYRCAKEGCGGEVIINPDTFRVLPQL